MATKLIETTVSGLVLTLTVKGVDDVITIDAAALSDEIRHEALIHGLRQKISDGAAIPKADLPADETEAAEAKFNAMAAIANRLREGDWKARSGDGAAPVSGIILRAYTEWAQARAAKAKATLTEAQIRATYDAKSKSERLALRNHPEIAAIMERIKSERGADAAKKVDTEGLLAELGL